MTALAYNDSFEISIYVACLSSYNAGRLHGVWIDATLDEDIIQEQVEEMLQDSPEEDAEEWAIHDYDGFGSLELSEYESFETVSAWANLIEEYGEPICLLSKDLNDDCPERVKDAWEDGYIGTFKNAYEYGEHLLNESGDLYNVCDSITRYFDFEEYGQDDLDDCIHFEYNDYLYVFNI